MNADCSNVLAHRFSLMIHSSTLRRRLERFKTSVSVESSILISLRPLVAEDIGSIVGCLGFASSALPNNLEPVIRAKRCVFIFDCLPASIWLPS